MESILLTFYHWSFIVVSHHAHAQTEHSWRRLFCVFCETVVFQALIVDSNSAAPLFLNFIETWSDDKPGLYRLNKAPCCVALRCCVSATWRSAAAVSPSAARPAATKPSPFSPHPDVVCPPAADYYSDDSASAAWLQGERSEQLAVNLTCC